MNSREVKFDKAGRVQPTAKRGGRDLPQSEKDPISTVREVKFDKEEGFN